MSQPYLPCNTSTDLQWSTTSSIGSKASILRASREILPCKPKWSPDSLPDLTGKVALVTGGNCELVMKQQRGFSQKMRPCIWVFAPLKRELPPSRSSRILQEMRKCISSQWTSPTCSVSNRQLRSSKSEGPKLG